MRKRREKNGGKVIKWETSAVSDYYFHESFVSIIVTGNIFLLSCSFSSISYSAAGDPIFLSAEPQHQNDKRYDNDDHHVYDKQQSEQPEIKTIKTTAVKKTQSSV